MTHIKNLENKTDEELYELRKAIKSVYAGNRLELKKWRWCQQIDEELVKRLLIRYKISD